MIINCVLFAITVSYTYGYPQSDFHHFPLEDFLSSHENFEDKASHGQNEGDKHSFFPSFSPFEPPPLGHSRPFLFQPEGAFSQKPTALQNELSQGGLKKQFNKDDSAVSRLNLLGSGNFGVLKGGTFYNDHDGDASDVDYQYRSYYQNGHGRPSYYPNPQNPKPQRQQFANFKDFADINTPSYSQYVAVYAKQNDSASNKNEKVIRAPKNIFEQLALLDQESGTTSTTTEQPSTKKISKAKQKLTMLMPEKKWKMKSTTTSEPPSEPSEPMLALS
ncbi:uncharacterized protein LOC108739388 [Agrilus planipennis]|uniref:Uncharacterized protein LOC108739388 n=1 Tax=Agrilus planipennis TaxID=224129 RepID=A0A1W4X8V9_AGRPL|nr:uncharacterized protein LOC108739388 [Agrilus planipennis]